MARGVGNMEAVQLLAAVQHADVRRRHGQDLAPEPLHVLAVQPLRACEQSARVDQVRRAPFVHPDLQVGPALDECARRARMVEMDVRQREHAGRRVAELLQQRRHTRRRAAVDQQIVEQEAADQVLVPELADVNRSWLGAVHPSGNPTSPARAGDRVGRRST